MSTTYKSKIDKSVNFVESTMKGGKLESRYVRRDKDTFIIYLSSQTGCSRGCRMCHLTTSKQTKASNASQDQIWEQAKKVMEYYEGLPSKERGASVVHFDFMARGEPLMNPEGVNSDTLKGLQHLLPVSNRLYPRYLISTIMPKGLGKNALLERFDTIQPEIYYSIYSLKEGFRKKWLPNAMDPEEAISMLVDWQNKSRKLVKLHWAFIKGENDTEGDVQAIMRLARESGLRFDVNIVRYNPPFKGHSEETDQLNLRKLVNQVKVYSSPGTKVDLVDRVGEDVHASCGMFVS